MWSEAEGGAMGTTCQDGAHDQRTHGRSAHLIRVTGVLRDCREPAESGPKSWLDCEEGAGEKKRLTPLNFPNDYTPHRPTLAHPQWWDGGRGPCPYPHNPPGVPRPLVRLFMWLWLRGDGWHCPLFMFLVCGGIWLNVLLSG